MKAILISAGKGTRLYPLTKDLPKALVDIGSGVTLFQKQVEELAKSGVTKIYIVAGYYIEKIEVAARSLSVEYKVPICVIHNPFYNTSNNIISVWLALQFVNEPCITINGDNIFRSSVIKNLILAKGDIVLTATKKPDYDFDDMLIYTCENYVQRVGKFLDRELATGESVGIIKYSKSGRKTMLEKIDQMVRSTATHDLFYLHALDELMQDGYKVNYCNISSDDWSEIDYHPDVKTLRENIFKFYLDDRI